MTTTSSNSESGVVIEKVVKLKRRHLSIKFDQIRDQEEQHLRDPSFHDIALTDRQGHRWIDRLIVHGSDQYGANKIFERWHSKLRKANYGSQCPSNRYPRTRPVVLRQEAGPNLKRLPSAFVDPGESISRRVAQFIMKPAGVKESEVKRNVLLLLGTDGILWEAIVAHMQQLAEDRSSRSRATTSSTTLRVCAGPRSSKQEAYRRVQESLTAEAATNGTSEILGLLGCIQVRQARAALLLAHNCEYKINEWVVEGAVRDASRKGMANSRFTWDPYYIANLKTWTEGIGAEGKQLMADGLQNLKMAGRGRKQTDRLWKVEELIWKLTICIRGGDDQGSALHPQYIIRSCVNTGANLGTAVQLLERLTAETAMLVPLLHAMGTIRQALDDWVVVQKNQRKTMRARSIMKRVLLGRRETDNLKKLSRLISVLLLEFANKT